MTTKYTFTRAEVEAIVEAAVDEAVPPVYSTPEGNPRAGDTIVKRAMLALRRRLDRAEMVVELDSYSKVNPR